VDRFRLPVKHGGLGAQMADVAAAGIAPLAGDAPAPEPLRPVIRGVLHTPPDEKVVAEELGPFLATLE
jgi:hypothetical protein